MTCMGNTSLELTRTKNAMYELKNRKGNKDKESSLEKGHFFVNVCMILLHYYSPEWNTSDNSPD